MIIIKEELNIENSNTILNKKLASSPHVGGWSDWDCAKEGEMVCLFCGVEFGAERVQFSNLGSSTWIYCLFKGVGDGDAVGVSFLKGSVTFCFPSSLNPKKNQHF